MKVLEEMYGQDRCKQDGSAVSKLVDFQQVQLEHWFFASHMRSNKDVHKYAKALWAVADKSTNCSMRMPETMKLVRLIMCISVGSVQNERRFSQMTLIRSKTRNSLHQAHLNVCMRIGAAAKTFATYKTFDHAAAVKVWLDTTSGRRGLGA